jgi:hypothetical protein
MLCNPTELPSVSLKMPMKPCWPMEVRDLTTEPQQKECVPTRRRDRHPHSGK